MLLQKLKIDDPVDASPVHGFCGIWGVLACGFFDWGKGVVTWYQIYSFFGCFFGGSKGSFGVAHMGEEVIFQAKTIVLGWLLLPFPAEVCPGSLPRLEWLRVHGEHRWILQDRYWRHGHWRTIHPGLHGDCVVWHPVCHHLCPPETHRPGLLGPISWVVWMWPSVINFVGVISVGLLCNQSEFKYALPENGEKSPCR